MTAMKAKVFKWHIGKVSKVSMAGRKNRFSKLSSFRLFLYYSSAWSFRTLLLSSFCHVLFLLFYGNNFIGINSSKQEQGISSSLQNTTDSIKCSSLWINLYFLLPNVTTSFLRELFDGMWWCVFRWTSPSCPLLLLRSWIHHLLRRPKPGLVSALPDSGILILRLHGTQVHAIWCCEVSCLIKA